MIWLPEFSASFLTTLSLALMAINMESPSFFKNYLTCKLAFLVSFIKIVFLNSVKKSIGLLFLQIQSKSS